MGLSGLGSIQKISTPDRALALDAQGQIQNNPEHPNKPKSPAKETDQSLNELMEKSRDKLDRIAKAMENYVQSIQRDLRIRIDEKTDEVVIQVISKSEGKIIRQIPPEELLKLAAKMEEMTGLLLNESA